MTEKQTIDYLKKQSKKHGILIKATCRVMADESMEVVTEEYAGCNCKERESIIMPVNSTYKVTRDGVVLSEIEYAELNLKKTAKFFYEYYKGEWDKMQMKGSDSYERV